MSIYISHKPDASPEPILVCEQCNLRIEAAAGGVVIWPQNRNDFAGHNRARYVHDRCQEKYERVTPPPAGCRWMHTDLESHLTLLACVPGSKSLSPIEGLADALREEDRPPKVVINPRNNTATLHYAYPYEIDLNRIQTERDLLKWGLHLCEKNWIDTERLHEAVTAIAKHKGFDLHGLYPKAGVTQDWPVVTTNAGPGEVREWVHEVPPRYYLFQPKTGGDAGKWAVIDRVSTT